MCVKKRYYNALLSKFPTNNKRVIGYKLVAAITLVALNGCSDLFEPTIAEMCDSNNEICSDLSTDARCRAERAEIIRTRYYNIDNPNDDYKYPLLLHLENYLACVEVAQYVEHIKHKDKEASRLKGVINAQKEITRLSRETMYSADPYLSYYHWSRFNDEAAYRRFERYAATNKVKDPELLVDLASVLIKTDQERTIDTLYRALSLYKNSENIDIEIYHSLASIGMDSDNYRLAYVWYGVAEEFDERLPDIQRVQLGQRFNLPVALLDDIIEEIVKGLENNTFDADELQLRKL